MSINIRDVEVYCTAPEGINLVVVKVLTTEPDLYGLGCATFSYRHQTVIHLIETYLKPLIIGKPVDNIEDLWFLMHHNAYWRNGPISNNAISGIDMALWDIKGKMAGMPLYQLFGGKCREGVPVYRHVEGNDSEEICDNILRYKEMGISYVRCQSGGYGGGGYGQAPETAPMGSPDGIYLDNQKYIKRTVKLFDDIRTKFGDTVALCHDVHERLSLPEAVRLAKLLEPHDLFFLEDAVPLDKPEWLKFLRSKTSIPLAQGELFNNSIEWKQMIIEGLIDYIRVHLTQIGGITPSRKLQIFAEQFGVRTAWHGPGDMSPIAHAANIHIDLTAHNFGVQEWSGTEPPNFIIQDLKGPKDALLEVFPGMPVLKGGYVYPNEQPGLGVDFDAETAAKFPCENTITTWTQTRLKDGTIQTP